MLILISVAYLVTYENYAKKRKDLFETESTIIEQNISETLSYLSNYMKLIGREMSVLKNPDIDSIEKIITKKVPRNFFEDCVFSWTFLDYVNEHKKLVVNSVLGRILPPIDMSHREHLNFTNKVGWKLFFSRPALGSSSKQMVLPTAMGIYSDQGKFFGSIVVGLNLKKLSEKLERLFINTNLNFVITDHNNEIIAKSLNLSLNKTDLISLAHLKFQNSSKIYFENPTIINEIGFYYFMSFKGYPFNLFLGENMSLASSERLHYILPIALELSILSIISIGIVYYLQFRICNPISRLAEAASIIAQDREVEVPLCKYREINVLSKQISSIRDIKKMLTKAKLETELTNISLEEKVEQRTKDLKLALAVKTEFLNNISHEVRTPIHGFLGISEGLTLNWKSYTDKQKHKYISEIAKNAKRLASLVNHLLDLSKFSEGKIVLDCIKFNLEEAVNEVIDECKSLYVKEQKIKIKFVCEEEISLFADRERIIQVLRNLFINAIKFSNKNAVITARISKAKFEYNGETDKEFSHFQITDQGIGIPEREIEEIFKPFTQSSYSKTGAGGVGLGLSICKEIIEMHQGKIWAENNLAKGASFNFIIPLSGQQQVKKTLAKATATLLIIDDENSCLTAMEMLLGGTNYKLIKATGGYEGLELIEAYKDELKLVLLDLMLPDIYGLKVLEEIKRRFSSASMPVIIQTGTYDKAEIDKALGNGAVAYIRKPYQRKEVLDMIVRFVA